jgi:hypothetical protein
MFVFQGINNLSHNLTHMKIRDRKDITGATDGGITLGSTNTDENTHPGILHKYHQLQLGGWYCFSNYMMRM